MEENNNTTSISDVDFTKIGPKKVQEFIQEQQLNRLSDFAKLQSFSLQNPALEKFNHHIKKFVVEAPINLVWDVYKKIHPRDAWSGKILTFGLQYDKQKNALSYLNDHAEMHIAVGQILFINVGFFGGLVNIAVGHEVTDVNEAEKSFRTCYLLSGKAAGTQQIRLRETTLGHTEITHHTQYKSDSKFRDHVLYPYLHTSAITEFHTNIKNKILKLKA